MTARAPRGCDPACSRPTPPVALRPLLPLLISMPTTSAIELRGRSSSTRCSPQFAATCATNSDGFFPVAGESSFWLEVQPGIVINRLMDVALKGAT